MKTVTVTLDLSDRCMNHLNRLMDFYGIGIDEAIAVAAALAIHLRFDQVEGGAS